MVELPDPEAGPGELRLRVHAATVNPTDTVLRSGGRADRLKDVPPPHVPGMDAAGVLEQIGEGVDTDLRVGTGSWRSWFLWVSTGHTPNGWSSRPPRWCGARPRPATFWPRPFP